MVLLNQISSGRFNKTDVAIEHKFSLKYDEKSFLASWQI